MKFSERLILNMTEGESDIFGAGEIFTEYNQHLEKEAEVKEKLREVTRILLIVIMINILTCEGDQGAGGRGSGYPHPAPEDPQARGGEGGRGHRDQGQGEVCGGQPEIRVRDQD